MKSAAVRSRTLRLRTRLVLAFTLVFAGVFGIHQVVRVFGLSAVGYPGLVEMRRAEATSQLDLVADLKKDRLVSWLEERKNDARLAAASMQLRDDAAVLRSALPVGEGSKRAAQRALREASSYARVRAQLERFTRVNPIYLEACVLDAATGTVLASTVADKEGTDVSRLTSFQGARTTGNTFVGRVRHDLASKSYTLRFAEPLSAASPAAGVSTVLVLSVDTEALVGPILHTGEALGDSGEALLVDRHARLLTTVRHALPDSSKAKVLEHQVKAEPARLAAAGHEGRLVANDYRGVEVMAAHRYVQVNPTEGWGLVVKQDWAEISAPLRRELQFSLAFAVIGLGAGLVLMGFFAATLTRPLSALTAVSRRQAAGDPTARSGIQRGDEIGELATAFDSLVERNQHALERLEARGTQLAEAARELERSERVQAGALAATAQIASAGTLDDLLQRALGGLMEATRSQIAALYLLHTNGVGRLRLALALGARSDTALASDIALGDGFEGLAATQSELVVLHDIPAETRYTVRTLAGDGLPNCLIAVPLRLGETLVGLVSLASLYPALPEQLEILELVRSPLAMALANARSYQETQRLAAQVQSANDELASANEELHATNEELRAQSARVLAQQAQVEAANRLKSEFLSNMSHELRTPLNSVLALTQLMLSSRRGAEHDRDSEYLCVIERNGRALLNLINDVLDLSKVEAGRLELTSAAFDPRPMALQVLETVRPLAESKGLALRSRIDQVPQLYSDERRVRQILLNLLSNAAKFTDQGEVELIVRLDDTRVAFEVRDTGPGIPPEFLPHLFEPFRQADGSTTRRHDGTGLGLAITQRLASLLGGEVSVRSQPGQGSVFTFALPVGGEPGVQAQAPSAVAAPSVNGLTVLVIDDDSDYRRELRAQLEQGGYRVIEASGGNEGLALARRLHPAVITLDLLMPDMDGWEVLRSLKTSPETADLPVVLVSVRDDRVTGFALGATGYVVKPAEADALLRELRHAAAGRVVKRVVVADDDPYERERLCRLLREGGYQSESVAGGEEALAIVAQSPPDALVLDLMMPGMDGFETLGRMREGAGRDLPVVVVTAKELSTAERARLQFSVQGLVSKGPRDRTELLRQVQAAVASARRQTASVLVVEDNDVAVLQLRTALEQGGFQVRIARGGAEALQVLQQQVPDALVLDLMMPEVDGFAVLSQVRANAETSRLPVLVLTAKELTSSERTRLQTLGVHTLVQKGSVDRQELLTLVTSLARGCAPPAPPRPAGAEPVGRPPSQASGNGLVLVVEDNPDNRYTIAQILDGAGIEHTAAEDGEQALKTLRERRPAVVLMDVQLPGMSGIETLQHIKRNPTWRDVAVIAVTSRAMKGDEENLLTEGFDGYVSKPLEPEDLVTRLRGWLKARGWPTPAETA